MRRNFLTEKTTSFASLASLFVAFFMALTPLALTACAPQATETPNPNPGVVNPVDPAEPEKPNVSQYSQILQTVLTDPTYIQMAKEIMHPLEYINKYIGYPYGFLSQQGYDIETLKKDELDGSVNCYTIKSDTSKLYFNVRVEKTNTNSSYFIQYVLSFDLTPQEYEDLKMLYSGNYAQSSLFVQELSYQKTANILSCIKIDKTSVENCITAIQKNEEIQQVFNNNAPTSVVITDITEVSNLIYRMKYKLTYFQTNNRSICEGTMGDVILDLKWNAGVLDQNDVYKINYPGRSTINNFEEFSNSLQIVEIYTVQLYPKLLTYNA